jgi:hypothetical protein
MKIGDIVTFMDKESRYAKWFMYQIAIVQTVSPKSKSCRVKWINPVKYFDTFTTISDFKIKSFEVHNESR